MEGSISFWGYKEHESNLILPEHDDDDDDDDDLSTRTRRHCYLYQTVVYRDKEHIQSIINDKGGYN